MDEPGDLLNSLFWFLGLEEFILLTHVYELHLAMRRGKMPRTCIPRVDYEFCKSEK
jgi:hypothetical protein